MVTFMDFVNAFHQALISHRTPPTPCIATNPSGPLIRPLALTLSLTLSLSLSLTLTLTQTLLLTYNSFDP